MEYNQTLERLGKWINVLHKSILVFAGIEALIVLIIGVASSNIYHEKYSDFWTAILVILGILYLIITMIKIAYKKSFPTSIIDELKSKKSLETANDSIKRKDAINNYISNTVIALSNCKCEIPVLKEEDDWKLYSDKDFKKGIKSLTLTFNSILNILLNTSNIKFSTAIYVNDFRAIKHENHPGNNSGIFFLRDDYEIEKINTLRDLMSENNLSGLDLEIQNKIKVSFNNGKYLAEEIETKKDKKILLICSNIKDLKSTELQKGVLFILTQPIESLPNDIESVLTMFTNIISHWLDLYQHEVISRQIEIMKIEIEEEEKKLEGNND